MSPHPFEVHTSDIQTLRAAELMAWIIEDAVQARGVAHMAISGGHTPRPLYRLLAQSPWQERIPWAHTHIWWVDERCVPPDHPESNYATAYALWLQHQPVVIIHRIRGEESPTRAAALYEQELQQVFEGSPWPRFDLILLGMGADGHTASLFPGDGALRVRDAWVTVGHAPTPPRARVTLTLPLINQARYILFLVTGRHKAPALRRVFGETSPHPPPAALVDPEQGHALWLLDEAVAREADLPFFPGLFRK